jgi:hypothetical protein
MIGKKLKPWSHKSGIDIAPEEWEKLGKPEMWVIQDEYKQWRLYQDYGYGKLALTTWGNQRIIVAQGQDYVCNEDQTIIGLGPYHLGNKARIYVQATEVTKEANRLFSMGQ